MNSTHDEDYLRFLQKSFGTTSVPFFGVLMVTISLILISIIVLFNSATVFVKPQLVLSDEGGKKTLNADATKLVPTTGLEYMKITKPTIVKPNVLNFYRLH